MNMLTVAETASFISVAKEVGMTDAEREAAINMLAGNPEAGDLIVGSGGCRKVRLAGRGKGKSGGYRLITFFGGRTIPVYLLTVFSKGERANLSQREVAGLSVLTKALMAAHKGAR